MKKQLYQITINAPADEVYRTLLGLDDIATYERWTSEFNPTSTYEGSWDKGSRIYFIGTDENGKRGGMVSEIANHVPGEFVSIRHIGILDGENEITDGPDVEKWAGGLENYSFEEVNGVTTVSIEIDVVEEHQDYFDESWPKALNTLKELVER